MRSGWLWGGIALFGLVPPAVGKEAWPPVTPEELAGTKSTFEPDAAVESLVWRIDVDDSAYPGSRRVELYVRYKIYDPEKADRIMRLAEKVVSFNGTELRSAEMRARLSLPDGSVKNFGKESVRERDLVKNSTPDSFLGRFLSGDDGWVVKEKFLAVGGAVPGAILEFRNVMTERLTQLTYFRPLQFEAIPTRQLVYHQTLAPTESGYVHSLFTFNPINAAMVRDDKAHTVTVTAHDIGSLRIEPLSGSWVDRTMTLGDCYVANRYISPRAKSQVTRHFTAAEPWAPIATLESWIRDDHVSKSENVKKKAAELTQAPGTPGEKAKRIHDFVLQLHQQFSRTPTAPASAPQRAGWITEMDEVLKYAPVHPPWLASADFLWLELSLYQAAGFQADVLMVPDRDVVFFDRRKVLPSFLPGRCVALHLGEAWVFSLPNSRAPLGFGELPWEYEGLEGLLGRDQKQEFIDVPAATAEASLARRTGTFRLDESGTLSGEGRLALRGHEAYLLRLKLAGKTMADQRSLVQRTLAEEFDGAEVELTDLRHLEDPYAPLEAAFKLTWPGFGIATEGRMIFRPFVYRSKSHSPFSAAERRAPIVFPFRRQEIDELTIGLPPGYSPEAKSAPPSFPGENLSYAVSLALDRKNMVLHVSRVLTAGLLVVRPDAYPGLKDWYDAVALSDQHNLVLIATTPAGPDPAKSPAAP